MLVVLSIGSGICMCISTSRVKGVLLILGRNSALWHRDEATGTSVTETSSITTISSATTVWVNAKSQSAVQCTKLASPGARTSPVEVLAPEDTHQPNLFALYRTSWFLLLTNTQRVCSGC